MAAGAASVQCRPIASDIIGPMEWIEKSGRNREGDKFSKQFLVDEFGRIYATIDCPVCDEAEFLTNLHMTAYSP